MSKLPMSAASRARSSRAVAGSASRTPRAARSSAAAPARQLGEDARRRARPGAAAPGVEDAQRARGSPGAGRPAARRGRPRRRPRRRGGRCRDPRVVRVRPARRRAPDASRSTVHRLSARGAGRLRHGTGVPRRTGHDAAPRRAATPARAAPRAGRRRAGRAGPVRRRSPSSSTRWTAATRAGSASWASSVGCASVGRAHRSARSTVPRRLAGAHVRPSGLRPTSPRPSWPEPSSPGPSWPRPCVPRSRSRSARGPCPESSWPRPSGRAPRARRPPSPPAPPLALLGRLDAGAQRGHEVDDGAGGRLRLGRRDDLAALDLGLDHGLQRLAVLVLVLRGVELAGERLDEAAGHRQLLRAHLDVLVEEAELGRAHLVRPQHRLEHEHAVAHAQRRQRLPVAQRHLDDGDLAGLLERVAQQHVRLDAGLVGLEVVALLEEDRVELAPAARTAARRWRGSW